MAEFTYREDILHAEGVPLPAIAEAVGTPFYCYAEGILSARFNAYAAAFAGRRAMICYALKANSNQAVLKRLALLGAGADVVSGGELARALAAGIPGDKIVFSGVGKSADEMTAALAAGIRQINVESRGELELLNRIAGGMGKKAPVAFRVNPNVDARTHAKITTGTSDNKFGIDVRDARTTYQEAAALPHVRICGIAVHIGSQLTDLAPFAEAFGHTAALIAELRRDGHEIDQIDLGGGLGIDYGGIEGDRNRGNDRGIPAIADYAAMVEKIFADEKAMLIFEPGRSIVGPAGSLVTSVLYIKDTAKKHFVIVDAAMNDLLRPALYDARHPILPVSRIKKGEAGEMRAADIVGPVCETADCFAESIAMPPLGAGDLLAIGGAGAYGAVMASTYNTRPRLTEVMVKGNDFAVIHERQTIADLIAADILPPWLKEEDAAASRERDSGAEQPGQRSA